MPTRMLVTAALVLGLVPALALASQSTMSPVVSAKMTGAAEAPAKGEENGSGIAVIHFNASKGTVCWQFKQVKHVTSPSAAHIHKGAKGKAGPVFIPLGGKYKAKGCTKATRKAIEAVETRPGRYYVNIHNGEYPNGAIRGQLVAGMVK